MQSSYHGMHAPLRYMRHLEEGYRGHSYHNKAHAADVLQTLHGKHSSDPVGLQLMTVRAKCMSVCWSVANPAQWVLAY